MKLAWLAANGYFGDAADDEENYAANNQGGS
jgi:hypothetical protein